MSVTTSTPSISPSASMLGMISGFWISRVIHVAAQLRIADFLSDGARTCDELANATGTHAPSLYRVLRALISVGVLAEDEGRFMLTPVGATLQHDTPGSLRAWALLVLGEERYLAWGDLLHTVRTGETAFEHRFGMGLWQYAANHPDHGELLDQAMANLLSAYNAAVMAGYSFSMIEKIVDVGGGDGSLLIGILQANPGTKGVLFDLPHVVQKAEKRIADVGLANRCTVVAGDAFVSVPSGGDAYVLSRIMDSWDDARALTILNNCRTAMTAKGKLLLIERVLPERVENSIGVLPLVMSDLNMMVITGGRERTATEYAQLVQAAGFRLTRVIPSQSVMSVIECAPI
jgi:O-methyltransferase domain/Dimerisation domain